MKSRLLDLFYPPVCELCRTGLSNGNSICLPCADKLPRVREPFCQICGEGFDGNLPEDFTCPNCHGVKLDFDFARAPLQGLEAAFELVHSLKYHRRFYIAKDLAKFLNEAFLEDPRFRKYEENSFVIPVPLHWRRQQWRQGNQAHELAREFCKISSLPISCAIKRTRSTETQTKLNRHQRLTNLKGAFTVKKAWRDKLKGANVILIDDVFTTGATSLACTRILKKEGQAANVAILSLVRG